MNHSYKSGDKVWIKKNLFKDSYSKSLESDKLFAKRFGPCTILELVGKNARRLNLPSHLEIHVVVNMVHTVPHSEQPSEIAAPVVQRPDPVTSIEGTEYIVDKILKHRKQRGEYQFLTLMKELEPMTQSGSLVVTLLIQTVLLMKNF